MWNPQKAGYLLRNILGSKVVKTNLKGLPYQLFCYQEFPCMREKSVEVKWAPVGVMENLGEWCGPRHLTVAQSYEVCRQKPSLMLLLQIILMGKSQIKAYGIQHG
ncbi:hypothetical protein TNCV_2463941 [Trichonephila clavipes]|nr:hypothetical protein TNCV_2463941 [Trichonephila clavipes]